MKFSAILALAAAVSTNALFQGHEAPKEVEVLAGEHIVVLNPYISKEQRGVHIADVIAKTGANVMNQYEVADQFQGYHVKGLSSADLEMLQSYPDVAYVQPNYVDHIMEDERRDQCVVDRNVRPWGIKRIVKEGGLPFGNDFIYDDDECGEGVELYILDTGIRTTHEDFGGRADWIDDYAGDGRSDGNGHGTHVASSAGGSLYGLARCAQIKALKVCTNGGSCPTSAQLGALTRLANDARSGKKIVANMSLGGFGTNTATLDAVRAAREAGAIVVVAAGNSNADSCNFSPAQSPYAVTVMSSDSSDRRSSFSNYGRCSEIFAPGSSILAAWRTSDTATNTISGTSMASPHVAGVAAMAWSRNLNQSPEQVERDIIREANSGFISNIGSGSPNELAAYDCKKIKP